MTDDSSNSVLLPSQGGINIEQGLDILSLRNSADASSDAAEPKRACGCHGASVPPEAVHWGQRIDMGEDNTEATTMTSGQEIAIDNEMKSIDAVRAQFQADREKRLVEINAKLQAMSVVQLVECVIHSQQERVASYRLYDRGLVNVLKTGNMSEYPEVCAAVTASFSVLSETINAVQKTLSEQHGRKDLASLIARLQKGEKEKLNLTAALHLEQIRAQAQAHIDEESMEDDKRISSLLAEGVLSLRQKISSTMEEINEALEELRFFFVEEQVDYR